MLFISHCLLIDTDLSCAPALVFHILNSGEVFCLWLSSHLARLSLEAPPLM